jgi:adenylate cyclase
MQQSATFTGMGTPPTALQRERLRLFLRIVAVAAAIGAVFGARVGFDLESRLSLPVSIAAGIVNAVLIAGILAGIEMFLLGTGTSLRRFTALPFLLVVVLKTIAYGAICTLVISGIARFLAQFGGTPLAPRAEMVLVAVSLTTTLIFVIVLQAGRLVGRRTFRNLMLGRYRRPRAERRYFLFADIIGSTPIAEKLGPLQAHRFLAAVISATAEPVAACGGEIYQYVGDEIVVTWTEEEGRPDARALRCYFLMAAALEAEAARFRKEFGSAPGLRGALHLGEVIAGEVGELRRAIVFHGDVMNTTARLEQATRDNGVNFIVSGAALETLARPADLAYRDLGELTLRGRKEPLRAWTVARAP